MYSANLFLENETFKADKDILNERSWRVRLKVKQLLQHVTEDTVATLTLQKGIANCRPC